MSRGAVGEQNGVIVLELEGTRLQRLAVLLDGFLVGATQVELVALLLQNLRLFFQGLHRENKNIL